MSPVRRSFSVGGKGCDVNGSMAVSKTARGGSNPSGPELNKMKALLNIPKLIHSEILAVWHELKQVHWYSAADTFKSSMIVLVATIATVAILATADQLLVTIRELLLNRSIV